MDDYNRVITNSCLQSHYIWKSLKKKITEEAPQLTEELKREESLKLLNPFPVLLSSITHVTTQYPQKTHQSSP